MPVPPPASSPSISAGPPPGRHAPATRHASAHAGVRRARPRPKRDTLRGYARTPECATRLSSSTARPQPAREARRRMSIATAFRPSGPRRCGARAGRRRASSLAARLHGVGQLRRWGVEARVRPDARGTSALARTAFDEPERAREEHLALLEDALGEPDAARRVLVEEERRAVARRGTAADLARDRDARLVASPRRRRASASSRAVSPSVHAEVARVAHERERRDRLERDADAAQPVDRRRAPLRDLARRRSPAP